MPELCEVCVWVEQKNTMLIMRIHGSVIILLLGLTGLIYGQTYRFAFVNYDDASYIYENIRIFNGLTPQTFQWALTTTYFGNWIPLTWLSYLIDFSLFEFNAGAYHLENALWHAINGILLYWVASLYTKQRAFSIFVAVLFVVHPMHVESVAWISERKDLLSTFFAFGCLLAYHAYATQGSRKAYAATIGLFACSLMAKPMLVTLPALLLLLDYAPLNRWEDKEQFKSLVKEKIPLLLVALSIAFITIFTQSGVGALQDTATFALSERIGNALHSYGVYIEKFFIPFPLIPFYPHPEDSLPLWKPALSVLFLSGISFLCWRVRKEHPAALVGWLWFLITLLPVIGFIQVGGQAMADRYSYVPFIGLSILVAAWVAPLAARLSIGRKVFGAVTVAWLFGLTALAAQQTAHWKNSVTLFSHTVAHSPRNLTALTNLGEAYLALGDYKNAIAISLEALSIDNESIDNLRNLGQALRERRKLNGSEVVLRWALSFESNDPDTLNHLAQTLFVSGRPEDAIPLLRLALDLDPSHADAHNNLGNALLAQNEIASARVHFEASIELNPHKAETWSNLGAADILLKDFDAAAESLRKSLDLDPGNVVTLVNYAVTLSNQGNTEAALRYARRVLEIDPNHAQGLALLQQLEEQSSLSE
ncbi:MAG: tetratricopeptide repeat protein [Candidatus Hydrogenedentota bacterium]